MTILDFSTFATKGPKHVPRVDEFSIDMDEQIAIYEPVVMRELFGQSFYDAFLVGITALDPVWTDLEARFDGLGYFLFFHITRNGLTNITDGPVTVETMKNSKTTNALKRLWPAWNMGVDWYERILPTVRDFDEFDPEKPAPRRMNPLGV